MKKIITALTLSFILATSIITSLSARPRRRRQPHMRAALRNLRQAEHSLQRARNRHKRRALHKVREAIREVKRAMHARH